MSPRLPAIRLILVGALLLGGAACDTYTSNDGSANDGSGDDSGQYSVAYKLAVIDGDAGEEAAFQDAIDCIMASGIKGAETEKKVGDVLYASWVQGGKLGTLLEWARGFC